ncbi:MAG: formylglycine-generating enzyme family protein [Deltaproteobacteria bacterium]|nr:formylglycine-generating enzyme family protein [Deltaproteobacteria bacterium]
MKQALIVLVFLASRLSFADAIFIDKIQKRYLVAYLDKGMVMVKTCLVIPKEGPARDCGGEVVSQVKLEDWLALSKNAELDSKSDTKSQKVFTLEAVTVEIERLTSGDTVDPKTVDERLKQLTGLQQRLVLVAKVEKALGSPSSDLFADVDWESLAVSEGELSDASFDPHFVFVKIPGKNFQMQTTEVTQRLWRLVTGASPSQIQGDDLPVETISFSMITEGGGFLEKLHTARRLKGDLCQYRLPTEEEWEYAARGGTTTDYSFGNDPTKLPEYGWFEGNAVNRTHSVAQLKKNPFGLYDVHGNVWEWTMTSEGSLRVARGGSWNYDAPFLLSACRRSDNPGNRGNVLGFRLLRTCL